MQLELTPKEADFLFFTLLSCQDQGPPGAGWQSPELEALTAKIAKMINETNT